MPITKIYEGGGKSKSEVVTDLVNQIKGAVYDFESGVNVVEVVGALELAKAEILEEQGMRE